MELQRDGNSWSGVTHPRTENKVQVKEQVWESQKGDTRDVKDLSGQLNEVGELELTI